MEEKDIIKDTLGKSFVDFHKDCKNKSSGYYSTSASNGNFSTSASNGNFSTSASSGYSSKSASSGYSSKSASSGDYSTSASSGDYSTSASSGDYSKSASSGNYSSATANGFLATVKGTIGNVIVAVEFNKELKPIGFAGGIVGQNGIKENTEYVAYNGELHEVSKVDEIFTIILKRKGNVIHGLNSYFENIVIISNGVFSSHGKDLKEAKKGLERKIESEQGYLDALKEFQKIEDNEVKSNEYWFDLHHKLTGSCEYGRRQFCKEMNISLNDKMTKTEFYNTVKDSYNGSKIKV